MGLLALCRKAFFVLLASVVILLYVPGIPPDVEFEGFTVEPSHPREGPLFKNFILDEAERLFEGLIVGPESIASKSQNEIFVSLLNGSIARIWGEEFNKIEIFANIVSDCVSQWEDHSCGRPLGMRFTKDKKLVVADSYYGIFSFDEKGNKKQLVDAEEPIDGAKPLLTDDLDIDSDGNIYWSDASSISSLDNSLLELLAKPSGRLIKYNEKTKRCEVLLRGVQFANGVQLSPDEEFVLLSETSRYRVLRYWLKGPKTRTSDVFVSGLPGMPDNIRPRKEGGYYVSLVFTRNPENNLLTLTSNMPTLKKLVTKATGLLKAVVDLINYYLPNRVTAKLSYKLFHIAGVINLFDVNEAIVVELDANGKIVSSLQGYKGKLQVISETQQIGDDIFFGSPFVDFLGRLKVSQLKGYKESQSKEKGLPSSKKEEL